MTDKTGDTTTETATMDDAKDTTPVPGVHANDDQSGAKVGRTSIVVMALIALSLSWYLVSDRFAPTTSQARVQGYVVGVAPEVAGRITQVWVSNNQEVDAGDRLFEVDPSKYEIALARAQSDLEKARSQVEAGNAAVAAARASLVAAEANALRARQDYQRLRRLRETDPGTISLRRLESSQASLDQALAKVTAAEADIQRAIEQKGGEDDSVNAILLSAGAAVNKAELDLSNTVVTASSAGLITDLRADVGQYAGTGNPVLTLIAIHDLWINAEFTENNLGNLKEGDRAEIVFDALPGRVFSGELRSIGLGVSTGQPPPPGTLPSVKNNRDWLRQAQRFRVEVGFSLSDVTLRRQMRLGAQATVIVYSEDAKLTKWLGKLYVRALSWLSFAY